MNPAERAAHETLERVYACLSAGRHFRLEAGAGAGKTYSLVEALRFLIKKRGTELMRRHQRVACITYTNVATDEIKSRIDGHPAVLASTIHAFCWSLIRKFQPQLRERIKHLPNWSTRIEEAGGIANRRVEYELGHARARKDEDFISLHHDDVLLLTADLMKEPKFRRLFVSRHPILFIDEYQDTSKEFADAICAHFLEKKDGPLIGLLGDHWQRIYDDVCGRIEHPRLVSINKEANFRSAKAIVDVLNRMRPELQQHVKDPLSQGSVVVYHTNNWRGTRLSGRHTKGNGT